MNHKMIFILILITFSVEVVCGQDIDNKSLIDFLSQQTDVELNPDNIYYEEVLGNEQEVGIYKFGVSGSHQDLYFFIKKGKELKIIKTLKMECIIIEISNFFLEYREKIRFQERVRYYNKILSLIDEHTTNNPWGVEN